MKKDYGQSIENNLIHFNVLEEDQSHGFKRQNESTYTKAIQISDNIHATMNWKSKFIKYPI